MPRCRASSVCPSTARCRTRYWRPWASCAGAVSGHGAGRNPGRLRAWNQTCPAGIGRCRRAVPGLGVISDVAWTRSRPRPGRIIDDTGYVVNDVTVDALWSTGPVLPKPGPGGGASDMMDGASAPCARRWSWPRATSSAHHRLLGEYASSYYGPFRDAVGSAGQQGQQITRTRWTRPTATRPLQRGGAYRPRRAPTCIMVAGHAPPGHPAAVKGRRARQDYRLQVSGGSRHAWRRSRMAGWARR